jgi:3-oxoadipate enol-lactonase
MTDFFLPGTHRAASDGAVLQYLERPATGPSAGTAVLLPSLFFGARMFEQVARRLPSEWRLICPDHRGQCGSASGSLAPTMARLAADTAEIIESLVDGPVHLVGSSMGGYVALELARQRPDLLRSCVLSCCTSEAEQQPERFAALEAALRDGGAARLVDGLVATMFGARFAESGGAALDAWRAHFAALDDRIPDAVHEVFARPGYVDTLPQLRTPLLLVSGALDNAKKPADMQFIADRVPGSRHIVMAASGHTPPIEEATPFADALAAFWSATVFPHQTKHPNHMTTETASLTSGSGFAADALPYRDLAPPEHLPFEIQDGTVRLRGSVSRSSGSRAFPARAVCPETGARDMEPMTFGPRGTLYSYSTVHVSSSRPTPYTIGYVDFDNGVRVLAQVESAGEMLACDQPVELRADGARWFVSPVSQQGASA